jgi:galactose mutarotase-like enzyme
MFDPEVQRCDAQALDIKLRRCPLQDAWREAGVPDADIATLCRIAGRVDNGTFEAAGFEFSADTWRPGHDGCCHLHIRPGR